jgi:hypothetical protein
LGEEYWRVDVKPLASFACQWFWYTYAYMTPPVLPIENFTYAYLSGPRDMEAELVMPITEGNCRLAIQLYYYRLHQLFIPKFDIYLPGGYKKLGRFVFEETEIDFFKLLPGDIVYAQNIKNKRNEEMSRNPEMYKTKDAWLFDLHSAIYFGFFTHTHYFWHATSIVNGTTVWSLDKFTEYYKPVSVKRVL